MIVRLLAVAALAVASVHVPDLDGKLVDPFESPAGTKATVLLFVSTDCPISNRYAPDVRKLYDTYKKDGVAFWLVYPNPADAVSDKRPDDREPIALDTALDGVRDVAQAVARAALLDPVEALRAE